MNGIIEQLARYATFEGLVVGSEFLSVDDGYPRIICRPFPVGGFLGTHEPAISENSYVLKRTHERVNVLVDPDKLRILREGVSMGTELTVFDNNQSTTNIHRFWTHHNVDMA